MQNRNLSQRLIAFAEYVIRTHDADDRAPRVLDLRLACRTQRLAEYSDWPTAELELIEQEVAGYGNETELSRLLAGEVVPIPIDASSWLDSPSPFAWT